MAEPELERVRAVYRARDAAGARGRYSLLRPGELFMAQQRERSLLTLLREHVAAGLSELEILEVGCGRGLPLVDWLRWGARPENLAGIDLIESSLRHARELVPQARIAAASGGRLPFADARFDLVMQLTVFSSILEPEMRRAVAREMLRVTRPGGAVLWYDVRVANPANPDLVAMPRREIRALFPGCAVHLRGSTLAPPLARRLAPWSFLACALLSTLPMLRTHWAALIRKPRA